MHKADWRTPAAYLSFSQYDRAGFAWEIIRRNQDYCTEFRQLSNTVAPDPKTLDRFSDRWGLRFRL
ncbi:transcriptional regulator domain-containing protein [Sphingopyxis indica]|uniref:transcriptional regulator domain-containing protein n=1 Tax=Sphingopyxis indica TaxID=436663 RepID=UPI003CCBD810